MTYLPTDADLALLNNHSSNIYCRIDMLNKDFITIDSLEGLVIDGSISIDSESDVRRTFNVTLYLGKKSGISSLTEEDWISKKCACIHWSVRKRNVENQCFKEY